MRVHLYFVVHMPTCVHNSGLQTLPLYGNYQVVCIVLGRMCISRQLCVCVWDVCISLHGLPCLINFRDLS